MSEEAVVSTESAPEVSQTSESTSSFDMKGAVDSISADLFGKNEPVKEVDEPEPKKEPKAKKEQKEPEKAPKETVKDETTETNETEESEPEEVKPKDAAERPASWKKDMQPTWDSMSKEAKDYVIHREEQMKNGLVKDRDDAVLGRTMRDTIAPYASLLKAQGIPEKTAVSSMMNFHYTLSTASPEQKQAAFAKLASSYGIKFDGQGQSQEIDPAVKNLTNELNSIKSYLTSSQQAAKQAATAKIANELDAFASDNSYFGEVENEIAIFLEGDKNMTLQQAYEKAIWANPLTRQKEMDRLQQEQAKKSKAEAEKKAEEARKAKSVNVKTKDTGRSPTAPKGTMFDTLTETFREIQQRK